MWFNPRDEETRQHVRWIQDLKFNHKLRIINYYSDFGLIFAFPYETLNGWNWRKNPFWLNCSTDSLQSPSSNQQLSNRRFVIMQHSLSWSLNQKH